MGTKRSLPEWEYECELKTKHWPQLETGNMLIINKEWGYWIQELQWQMQSGWEGI